MAKQETPRDKILIKIRIASGLISERAAMADPDRAQVMIGQQLKIMREARSNIARIKENHERAKKTGLKEVKLALQKAKRELVDYNARKDIEKLQKMMLDVNKLGIELGQVDVPNLSQ